MIITEKSSLLIYDWDDTLFPTSWMHAMNIEIPENSKNHFKKVDIEIKALLILSVSISRTVIVTNANKKWIQKCLIVLPLTKSIIEKYEIEIVSARDDYSEQYLDNIGMWKIKSFEDLFKKYKPNNIIAVGDAHYEINAVVNLYNKSNTQQRFFKTLKCVTIPSYQDILDQNKYLIKISKSLVNNKKNYDLLFKNTKR
jgi:hypothetical protein